MLTLLRCANAVLIFQISCQNAKILLLGVSQYKIVGMHRPDNQAFFNIRYPVGHRIWQAVYPAGHRIMKIAG
jgi:hypothetical protein